MALVAIDEVIGAAGEMANEMTEVAGVAERSSATTQQVSRFTAG